MSWIFTKIASLCTIIVNAITGFFTSSVLSKTEIFIKKSNIQINEEALELLKLYLEKTSTYEDSLCKLIQVRTLDCDRVVAALNKLVDSALRQEAQISGIVDALNTASGNQATILSNVRGSFEALSPAIMDIRATLSTIQTQISEQPITDFPHFLSPIQGTLTELLANQTALNNETLEGFRLTGESLTRLESINFTTTFATIIQNQSTLQSNLQAQVIATGSELGAVMTQLNVNLLAIPAESTAQMTEFFTANPALANIVANALI